MTLVEARELAIKAITEKLISQRPPVRVHPYDGAFGTDEIKRFYANTPSVLVSALSGGKQGVKLAAYLLSKSSDRNTLELVDQVGSALRHLPGEDRPVLDVESRTLYDETAGKSGARLWVSVALWPHKNKGAIPEQETGPIAEILSYIKEKVEAALPGVPIGITEAERSLLEAEGAPPFILAKAGKGQVNMAEAGSVKYTDESDGLYKGRKILGALTAPVTIEVWGRNELEAEHLGLTLFPALPLRETVLGLTRSLEIGAAGEEEEPVFTITLELSAQIGGEPVVIPTFKKSTAQEA